MYISNEKSEKKYCFRFYESIKQHNYIYDSSVLLTFPEIIENCKSKNLLLTELRREVKEGNKTNYDFFKPSLKAITVHNINPLSEKDWQSNGFINIDFDHINKEQIGIILTFNTLFVCAMISPSGLGVKLFIRVDNLTKQNFKNIYCNISNYITDLINITLKERELEAIVWDKSCNDVERLCYLSTSNSFNFSDNYQIFDGLEYNQILNNQLVFKSSETKSNCVTANTNNTIQGIKGIKSIKSIKEKELESILFVFLDLLNNQKKEIGENQKILIVVSAFVYLGFDKYLILNSLIMFDYVNNFSKWESMWNSATNQNANNFFDTRIIFSAFKILKECSSTNFKLPRI